MALSETLHADWVGVKVSNLFALPEYNGRVLSVVTGAVYLIGQDDEVFWLTHEKPMHGRAIRVKPLPQNLPAQSTFTLSERMLIFKSSECVDCSGAQTWRPDPFTIVTPLSSVALLDRIERIMAELQASLEARGFGKFLPQIRLLALGQEPTQPTYAEVDPVLQAAWKPIPEIGQSCQQQDLKQILEHCASLIGLGYGLTPSGDDFVGGLIFCLRTIGTIFPSMPGFNDAVILEFVTSQRFKTNIISYCILKDMCEGHASEAVHSFVQHFFFTPTYKKLHQSVLQLTQIGHSTGWDILAGILTGCLCLFSTHSFHF